MPVAFKTRTIGVENNSFALSFVQPKMTFENYSILPGVLSFAMFLPSLPHALIDISIHENHLSESVLFSSFELTRVIVSS